MFSRHTFEAIKLFALQCNVLWFLLQRVLKLNGAILLRSPRTNHYFVKCVSIILKGSVPFNVDYVPDLIITHGNLIIFLLHKKNYEFNVYIPILLRKQTQEHVALVITSEKIVHLGNNQVFLPIVFTFSLK